MVQGVDQSLWQRHSPAGGAADIRNDKRIRTMQKIGLVDVDGHHFPNLALMKLQAWHKSQGDRVEFADPMFGHYDRVYMSKVFTFTPDCPDYYPCEVVRAGTGYKDYTTTLPDEIEHCCPDYSLYGVDEAYGFLTRGCVNRCPWCIVPHKEGSIRPASPLREFIGDKRRAVLLDNNVLASDFGLEQIEEIVRMGISVDFKSRSGCTSGLRRRLHPRLVVPREMDESDTIRL